MDRGIRVKLEDTCVPSDCCWKAAAENDGNGASWKEYSTITTRALDEAIPKQPAKARGGISVSPPYKKYFQRQWDEKLKELVEYKMKHKTVNVPKGTLLARWVTRQRFLYNKGKLPKERIASLDAMDFEWHMFDRDRLWNESFERVLEYKREHKTANVHRQTPMGSWVFHQRILYKKGELSNERIARLEAIGFKWQLRNNFWNNMYTRLVEYKKKHQDTCVPVKYKEDPQLGNWVSRQRHHCKDKDRINLLNDIDFVWSLRDIVI